MGAWLGRRTEPRVDYREVVRVIWPGELSGVVARAVNLSSAGILVDAPTPTPCAVGSDVLCDVKLPRGPRLLRGRVAHRRLLPSAKVGMGIEFVDLSPREAAELRDVVYESDERGERVPQKVKVRFEGTNQIVRARAFPIEDGLRLATTLPFLKLETEVAIALSPDASVSARGWVSAVSLERGEDDGLPRLLIDVRIDAPSSDPDRTPSVEAVPEAVWEPQEENEVGATTELASLDGPVAFEDEEPTMVTPLAVPPPAELEATPLRAATGATPFVEESDLTELVELAPRSRPWRALGSGMLAGGLVLSIFVAGIVLVNALRPRTPPVAASAPVTPAPAAAPVPPPAPAPVAVAPVAAAPVAPAELVEPKAAPTEPMVEPTGFAVGLTGSLAGAVRYPLRNPDGVAFNLPHARASMKVGTYRPEVAGLRSMWVRTLPGGGAHLRFFFSPSRAAPTVVLGRDEIRVTPR